MAKNRILSDSAALASVKIFTMATSIVATMVLSRALPLADYGTYSTGNLIINTTTLVSAFGLIDAVNYYYNGKATGDRDAYVNTVFSLFFICGAVAAAVILFGQSLITQYFHNPRLGAIYAYIAFRPFLQNAASGLQNLQVSIGKARIVAIRNAVISTVKLGAILLTSFLTKDIRTIFICMLLVEIAAAVFYYMVLRRNRVHVRPFAPDWTKLREILLFCIPMGVYIQTNALSRDLDKYVIGFFETTEKLAIYSNCSAKLPFDLVSGPLLTLLIPLLTRCIRNDDLENGSELFRCYLKLGYTFTFAFGLGCILVARQAVELLYGARYLSGVQVFIVYVVVDLINFINYSLVLAAKGRTLDLMKISCAALAANLGINLLMYRWLGFIGPAIATVIVTLGVSTVLLVKSAAILRARLAALFDWRHLAVFFAEGAVLWAILLPVRRLLEARGLHYLLILAVVGGAYVAALLLMNLREVKNSFSVLNQIQNSEGIPS